MVTSKGRLKFSDCVLATGNHNHMPVTFRRIRVHALKNRLRWQGAYPAKILSRNDHARGIIFGFSDWGVKFLDDGVGHSPAKPVVQIDWGEAWSSGDTRKAPV